ncbi:hypothetical protein A676_04628 [Salmonella enterica subsp. enterica serovar Enteritidis str. 2010K-0262]|uniref:Uncharacterized protein n=1 Tax=Salmonella enteritidis (strain 2009K0958) TaxID=1192586 RepID=A0A656I9P1_SALE2|nr:hypothetical protein A673_04857 [Salmonella enterica subsp. enterica serovar Enteritidis str. 2009K0958]EPI63784.1 hypothetical protein A672_04552 [Salmonella enterica subsp. enterica serovar Enteritidis str. 08-1080]EPI79039.1 hypothetical protein A676_04628 [Salmonella enterica subsp. enterica serovar Enteritidis str. 2010K-0262]EPI87216.1 hypothetical protein A674_02113 [Salmonella enterica subsp. enterica serovar Enteritidis str. 2009K1651]EPJ06940.1 hypothetical protein A680_05084 [Salm
MRINGCLNRQGRRKTSKYVRPCSRFPHRAVRLHEVTLIDISLNSGSTFPGKKHIAGHLSL